MTHFLMNIKLKDLLIEAYIGNFNKFQRDVFMDIINSGVDLTPIFMDKHKMELFGGAIRQYMNSNYAPAGYDTGDTSIDDVKDNVKNFALKTIDMINHGKFSNIKTDKAQSM